MNYQKRIEKNEATKVKSVVAVKGMKKSLEELAVAIKEFSEAYSKSCEQKANEKYNRELSAIQVAIDKEIEDTLKQCYLDIYRDKFKNALYWIIDRICEKQIKALDKDNKKVEQLDELRNTL